MGILKMVDADGVKDMNTFARYVQQELGTPMPNNPRMRAVLATTAREHFRENPALTWESMVKVVAYCKNRRRRPFSAASVFKEVRYAWSAGYLPELDPKDTETQDPRVSVALAIETDEEWRRKLSTTTGEISTKIYEAWKEERLAEV